MKYVFFRNDDVRDKLDKSLIEITDLCVKYNMPISHAVEPANVSKEVVNWLLEMKNKHGNLIEIIQHGYNHKLNYTKKIGGKLKKGEFGGDRTYEEQYNEIKKGKELMDSYFGSSWFSLFTFPFGARNNAAIKAVSDAGFKVVNGSKGISFKLKLFYIIGRLFNKEIMFDRKISWHLMKKPGTNLFQIDMSFGIIKSFINTEDQAVFFNLEQLKNITIKNLESNTYIGIVLHHRYHNSTEISKLFDEYLQWLKELPNISFVNQEQVYNQLTKK